jgi:hypothetical protein
LHLNLLNYIIWPFLLSWDEVHNASSQFSRDSLPVATPAELGSWAHSQCFVFFGDNPFGPVLSSSWFQKEPSISALIIYLFCFLWNLLSIGFEITSLNFLFFLFRSFSQKF